MNILDEAQQHLEKMKAHTDCCGTPMVRKLVAEVERLHDRLADAETSLAIFDEGSTSEYWMRHGLVQPDAG